jgi:hypothetical protein
MKEIDIVDAVLFILTFIIVVAHAALLLAVLAAGAVDTFCAASHVCDSWGEIKESFR